uniref:Uncharacterized protein n=1 Tax=Rhizophora mucronata TaxID=61149 RepID=A0A2P2LVK1_RHIMU
MSCQCLSRLCFKLDLASKGPDFSHSKLFNLYDLKTSDWL